MISAGNDLNAAGTAIDELRAELEAARTRIAEIDEALEKIARAEADGLDGARDTIVLERCIKAARSALGRAP